MKSMGKFFGFTLAEVLITLGIIGVVAAMTMPTLITKHQKQVYANQLKTNVSIISQAIYKYMADQGVDNLNLTPMVDGADELKEFFEDYVKVVNDCNGRYYLEGEHSCFAKSYKYYDGSHAPTNQEAYSCGVVLNLVNGASVCADVQQGASDDGDTTNNGVVGDNAVLSVEIDINGNKGPNVIAKDLFTFSVLANGKIVDPKWEELNDLDLGSVYTGALGYLMSNGWMMDY